MATIQIQSLYIAKCLSMFSALPAVCVFVLIKQWSCENLSVNLPYDHFIQHSSVELCDSRYPDKKE